VATRGRKKWDFLHLEFLPAMIYNFSTITKKVKVSVARLKASIYAIYYAS
jgi:hypothetical protein